LLAGVSGISGNGPLHFGVCKFSFGHDNLLRFRAAPCFYLLQSLHTNRLVRASLVPE
jgi:hypothetical protein